MEHVAEYRVDGHRLTLHAVMLVGRSVEQLIGG